LIDILTNILINAGGLRQAARGCQGEFRFGGNRGCRRSGIGDKGSGVIVKMEMSGFYLKNMNFS